MFFTLMTFMVQRSGQNEQKMGGIVTKMQSVINTTAAITGVVAFTATGGKTHFLPLLVLSGTALKYLAARRVY